MSTTQRTGPKPRVPFEIIRDLLTKGYTVLQVAGMLRQSRQSIYQRLETEGYNPDGTPKGVS